MDTVRAMAGLAPLAVAFAIYALIVAYVMPRDGVMGELLIAVVLVGHGFVHTLFGLPEAEQSAAEESDAAWPFDLSRSWLVSVGHRQGVVRAVGLTLVAFVVVGFLLAGLGTLGFVVPAGWWQPLVIGSSIASIALLVIGFSPALALGFAIDAILIWLVVGAAWTPASLRFGT